MSFRSCAIALLVAVLGVPTGAAMRAQDNSAEQDVTLRVLSYNIHHCEGTDGELSVKRIADIIRASNADLVALQEVDHTMTRSEQVDQLAELAKLTGLEGRFAKAIDIQGGEYGQAVLSRFPITEFSVHELPGLQGRETRVLGIAQIDINGSQLTFATTHLDHQLSDVRLKQAIEINRLMPKTDRPAIICGDFNAVPTSATMLEIQKLWTLVMGEQPIATIPSGKPTRQIDFVAVKSAERFKSVSLEALDEPIASDHLPVLAVVELR
ncbi:endonuclease/exonuclease/phosphatase family protein [Aureliella helgolandensis]|uniref:Endonuclease/exonuclease/phosphatase domain-containing protein n=1 Tax=Aureliella helgolandensis TaxID=2527968 RepID=A0A518G7M6_9BACT|nr:endonuclease/exonuclease/phosphatase family protein [Aureliella helgolandensis]QDV24593.1 hypothetical protein Q31a_29130 [Aureliella helgolandensis]